MRDEQKKNYLSCLVAAHDFETFWTYCHQCDGNAFRDECHQAALRFFNLFDKEPEIFKSIAASFNRMDLIRGMEECLHILRGWVNHPENADVAAEDIGRFNRLYINLFFLLLRMGLYELLEAGTTSELSPKTVQMLESHLKWRGHLPMLRNGCDPDELMDSIGKKASIVVAGDIRHSQELMKYAETALDFTERMVEFISRIRKLVGKHGGFFDKFTGDGFIAYFNEEISDQFDGNRNDSFVAFIRDCLEFSDRHFRCWTRHLKKRPSELIGLAIGADLGVISFQNLHHHVVAVGESIVWATRMQSAAKAGEVLVNNLLYEELRGRGDLAFNERTGKTKSREGFLVRAMSFSKQAPEQ
ncbi:MAG: adenylate/guanylate cyclase domain-containing protein [Verrucomicrobiota bacterium]|jgi:class 3 adenylate cyclase